SFSTYYPGDNYVDFAGIDGYNFGAMESWSQWELFPDVFNAAYKAIMTITDKPIIIGETASTEAGGNKADWITNAFSEMTSNYPRINAIIWFNEDKESDWRIDSSSASLAAYKAALAKLGENGDDLAFPLEVSTEPIARLLDFKKSKKPEKSAKKRTRRAGKILPVDNKTIYSQVRFCTGQSLRYR
ncbi:MAG: hypothetical protein KAX16_01335, partial [Actinomycetia bacterium]|nr:hypothetical protein [Actinomycetes bacterium]